MTGSNHLRLFELQKLRLGELKSEHPASCAECRARLDALEREERDFLSSTNIAADSAAILARLENAERAPRLKRWMFAVPALALTAILALTLFPKPNADPETTRIKGGAIDLEMFVKDAQGIHPADDGARLREGDAIQFRYRAGGRRFVFVASVAADGTVSPLYPDAEQSSIPVSPSGTHVLEGSIILDDSRGPERFFAFFSDEPISFDEVQRALKSSIQESDVTRLQEVEIGREDVDETSVLIFKE